MTAPRRPTRPPRQPLAAGRSVAVPTGDLRQRILDAAADLLRTEGVGALSMREVARRAGVTHQAPYHHFADRETILAELVMAGFITLGERLARANDEAPPGDLRRLLHDCGHAYVAFAMEQPGCFRIMFRRDLCDHARFPAVAAASERAYGELLRMVTVVHGAPDMTLATLHWSTVHGLATLMVDGGMAEKLPDAASRRGHVAAVVDQFVTMVLAQVEPGRRMPGSGDGD